MARLLARAIGWLFALLLAVAFIWFAANRLGDASIDISGRSFVESSGVRIPDERNVAVGILGLTAPNGVDFLRHGRAAKALYESHASYKQIQDFIRGPTSLSPTVSREHIECWVDPDWPWYSKECLPFEKVPDVLEQNRDLLGRYKSLYTLAGYENVDAYDIHDPFLFLTRLVIAEIHLDLRNGRHEEAYQKFRDQFRFVRNNLRGRDSWVGKAVGLVAFGMTLPVLDALLYANPGIAKVHAKELMDLLRPEGIEGFNPDGIARAEYNLLKRSIAGATPESVNWQVGKFYLLAYYLGQKERMLNRSAVFARAYARALRMQWDDMEREADRLRNEYLLPADWEIVIDPFGSLYVAYVIDSHLRTREMLRQMHISDGRLKLATLLVRMINEDVQGAEISAFLISAGPSLYDPFTSTPARWDPKDRKIFFVDAKDKCVVNSWFRVRDPRQSTSVSRVDVDTDACKGH